MDTPGYDPVSATGQVAGGANLICFTTGPRLGLRLQADAVAQAGDQHRAVGAAAGRHGPQLRRASSTATRSIAEMGEQLFQLMLDTASGQRSAQRTARLRPERIRALAARRGDVTRARPSRDATGAERRRSRSAPSRPSLEFDPGRRVVAGVLAAAHVAVDAGAPQPRLHAGLSSRWSMRRPASRAQRLRK